MRFRPSYCVNVILRNICKYLTYEMVWCRFWQSDRRAVRWDHLMCINIVEHLSVFAAVWLTGWTVFHPIGWQCGQREERNMKVVGGALSTVERHPWMAAVFSRSARGRSFTCGGSLISPCWVLTAAHCFPDGSVQTNRIGERKLQTCQCVPLWNIIIIG